MALLRWLAAGCSRHGLTPRRALCSGSARSFAELGLRAELIDAAHTLGYTSPSAVQEAAIPRLSAGASLAVASSTGSGKTLAYLLPVFEQLKAQEDRRPDMRSETRPRVIILVRADRRCLVPFSLCHTSGHKLTTLTVFHHCLRHPPATL